MTFSAIIFDMDGLLVDTEPIWYQVEAAMIEAQGYTYTDDVRDSTIGLRVDEFAEIIYKNYPKVGDSPENIVDLVMTAMLEVPAEQIKMRPGANEIVHYAAEQDIPRAIASSSHQVLIEHFVKMMSWDDMIPQRYSAEFMEFGKPAPDIYLHTAKQLGIPPEQCLALEDSQAGTRAALSAGMTCFSVPDLSHSELSDFESINSNVFSSLHEVLDTIKMKRLFT